MLIDGVKITVKCFADRDTSQHAQYACIVERPEGVILAVRSLQRHLTTLSSRFCMILSTPHEHIIVIEDA